MQKERPHKGAPNAPCPCGSGKKYKRCCALKVVKGEAIWSKVALFSVVILLIAGVGFAVILFTEDDADQPQRVWSPEHGHWHTVQETTDTTGIRHPQPPGSPPPGKVWSAEHRHWHDIQ